MFDEEEIYELALFAGGGGGVLASKYFLGWRTLTYVERDKYAIEVIKARIRDGWLDDAPIWSDVRSFTKRNNQCRRFIRELRQIRHRLVVTAGFPCQPFSAAGKREGEFDPRNLWPEARRIICEIRPAYVYLVDGRRTVADYIREAGRLPELSDGEVVEGEVVNAA